MSLSQFWKRAPGTVGMCRMPDRNLLPWFFVAGHSRVLVTELEKSSETKLFLICLCVCVCVHVCICQLHSESECEQFDLRNLYVSWEDFVVPDIVIFFNLHRFDCDCRGWKPAWPSHLSPFNKDSIEGTTSFKIYVWRLCMHTCMCWLNFKMRLENWFTHVRWLLICQSLIVLRCPCVADWLLKSSFKLTSCQCLCHNLITCVVCVPYLFCVWWVCGWISHEFHLSLVCLLRKTAAEKSCSLWEKVCLLWKNEQSRKQHLHFLCTHWRWAASENIWRGRTSSSLT